MLLKLKGWMRRIAASVRALSRTSVAAIVGILALAAVVAGIAIVETGSASTFSVQPAVADVPEAVDSAMVGEVSEVEPHLIVVHVGGCVRYPGVYELPEGNRLLAFVEAAGGMTEDAEPDGVNLARIARDGEHIVVPVRGTASQTASEGESSSLVSINAADAEELCTLDGIGAVLARRIIAYRERIGGFSSLAQLMDVSGIGQKRYEAIKDAICL